MNKKEEFKKEIANQLKFLIRGLNENHLLRNFVIDMHSETLIKEAETIIQSLDEYKNYLLSDKLFENNNVIKLDFKRHFNLLNSIPTFGNCLRMKYPHWIILHYKLAQIYPIFKLMTTNEKSSI